MLLLFVSFLAGILTILAPCVLPVLPVIVGGSISGASKDKLRPYVIAISLALSLAAFTLTLKSSTWLINIPPTALTIFSGALIIALGCVSVWPEAWETLVVRLNWQAASQRFLGTTGRAHGKYLGPVLVGVALGPVFASCSPTYAFILASVLPRDLLAGILYLLSYIIGLVVTLLILSLAGRRYIRRFSWAIDTHHLFRRSIGILFVIIGILIISGRLINFEIWAANYIPFDETRVEQKLVAANHRPASNRHEHNSAAPQTASSSAFNVEPTAAPELSGLTDWINSPALQLSNLKGKVVLVDFWTYSCINCLRTLPYLETWDRAYRSAGLVVVGINTPEFAFEHIPANVRSAVAKHGIAYPVALDNNYATWNAYNNTSWPADYLIDKNGYIRYVAFGEGDYDKTEEAIQALIGVHQPLQTSNFTIPITENQTPETYFGGNRRLGFTGTVAKNSNSDGSYRYTPIPTDQLAENSWTLSGDWISTPQYITSDGSPSLLTFHVNAKDVYLVAGSSAGKPITGTVSIGMDFAGQFGSDDPGGVLQINSSRLYHIAAFNHFGSATITLSLPPGVTLYTFTFGS